MQIRTDTTPYRRPGTAIRRPGPIRALHRVVPFAVLISAVLAVNPAQAADYDAILEWNGPYFRGIRGIQDQAVDVPVSDIGFLAPYAVVAREHDDRDVVYVLDSGNRRIQAFEVNATLEDVVNADLTYRSSGSSESAEWSGDEIRLPGWDVVASRWIVPRSEEVIINGTTWSWVSDLTGYLPADEVYSIDYDASVFGPRILLPAASLDSTSAFRLSYLISDNQTGASADYGIGDVDYGIGEGASPVLTEIDGTSGGPVGFQALRGLSLIRNETTSTSDDLFVVDSADNSGGLDESLFYYTVDSDGSVAFREAFGDSLLGPYGIAVARSGASFVPTVSVSSDLGLFDQGTAVVVDPNQVTGHTYDVTLVGSDAVVTDRTTGRVLASQDLASLFADPCYLIPGVELRTQVPTQTTSITTTRARSKRYIFVTESTGDRITVVSAADGAAFAGDWLPLDARSVITQPGLLLGGVADVDYAVTTPASVPANWTHWTVGAPIAEGSLDSLSFDTDGTWTRVDSLGTAGPVDKVYLLDRATGRIRFGDGTNGSIPPASEEITYDYAITPLVLRYGSSGSGPGEFDTPKGISARWNTAVGGYDLYVADSGNNRVQKLRFYEDDPALGLLARMEYVTEWTAASTASDTLAAPAGVAVRADTESPANVWVAVADTGNDRIVLYEDVAAGSVGGSTAPPVHELSLGTSGGSLGSYQNPVGVELLAHGSTLDIYAVDASRGIVAKYERAPDPTVLVNWSTTDCYGPHGAYAVSFTTVSPPLGGWVDFYFDTVPTFDEGQARLALPSGTVSVDDGTVIWTFGDTPGGAPPAGTYYLFAALYDSEGELLDTDGTSAEETLCIDAEMVPTLGLRDAIDGDGTLYFQNGSEGVLRLAVSYPDSVVAVRYEATFNPTVIEVVSITPGTAWDGTGATGVIFESWIDNTGGTFLVSSTGLDTPIGLTGAGPHVIANVLVRPRPEVIDLENRFVESFVHLVPGETTMTTIHDTVSSGVVVQDLDVRVAYLGDIATSGVGAEGEVGSMSPNPDGYIDFADIIAFTVGWNGSGFVRDRIADIGPAVGVAPDLVSNPDGAWDVDDLVVLTQMYSWASSMGFSHSGRDEIRRGAEGMESALRLGGVFGSELATGSGEASRSGPVTGSDEASRWELATSSDGAGSAVSNVALHAPATPHPMNASDDGLSIEVSASDWKRGEEFEISLATTLGRNALGVNLWFEFERGTLELLEAEPGGFLLGSQGQILLNEAGPGWAEVTGARLGQAPSPDVADEPFLKLSFRSLQDGPVSLLVRYELRDLRGGVLALGSAWDPHGTPGSGSGKGHLRLLPPKPNPTTGAAQLSFDLPTASEVRLRLLDAGGRLVRTVLDGHLGAGTHEAIIDDRISGGRPLAPGVYFVRLETGAESVSRKLVVVR